MCLIAFDWQPDGPIPLVIAANRDEYYERPTAALAWWEDGRILAGRDLRAGGTWLGVTTEGRCAAITNYRDPRLTQPDRVSRGQIATRFLEGAQSAAEFLAELRGEADRYNPFNLLLSDGADLLGYESHCDRVLGFSPGIHAVSNGAFDEPWPKVEALKAGLASGGEDDEALLRLLSAAEPYGDKVLPSTGVPLEWERALSSTFIRTPSYGTRASTILRLGCESVSILELRFTWAGPEGRAEFHFKRHRPGSELAARKGRSEPHDPAPGAARLQAAGFDPAQRRMQIGHKEHKGH